MELYITGFCRFTFLFTIILFYFPVYSLGDNFVSNANISFCCGVIPVLWHSIPQMIYDCKTCVE